MAESRLQRARLLADLVPGKPSDPASPGWGGMESDMLAQELMSHNGISSLAVAIANLLLWAVDEAEEQVHPIARVNPQSRVEQKRPPPPDELVGALHDPIHPPSGDLIASKPVHPEPTPLLDGLREAKAEATPRLQEKVDANPSGFIRPAPASPPGDTQESARAAANNLQFLYDQAVVYCRNLIEERDTLRAQLEAASTDSAILSSLPAQLSELTHERDTLRARVEESESLLLVATSQRDEARARIQQLEGESGALCAEVNRLNAEAFELRRKLEEAMRMGEQLSESSAVLIANRDAVVNVVRQYTKVHKSNCACEFCRSLSTLDQPSEPKT